MGVRARAMRVVVVSVMLVVAIVILVVAIAAMAWARRRRGADRCVSLARLPGAGVSLLARTTAPGWRYCKMSCSQVRNRAQTQILTYFGDAALPINWVP